MIRRLRNRFIRIATLSVAAVMLLLTVVLNTANFISTDHDLQQTLELIYENQGTLPQTRQDPTGPPALPATRETAGGTVPARRDSPFTEETPYSTRYFVLRYHDDGTLAEADLDRIASVTSRDVDGYLALAAAHGPGLGRTGRYRYCVYHTGDDRNMAIFLDSYQEQRSLRNVLMWSLLADAGCILLVFLLVVVLSRRAIDPVVQSAQRQKQFITDASHELKTPITVISTSLRVLEMETGPKKWIAKAQAQTEKLTALVNALVALSRMDEEDSPLQMAPFAVSEAVDETAESFRDFAASQGHTLTTDIAPGLTYCGDQHAVRQLVSILLDNAVKYALPDSDISLTLEKTRRGVRLAVANRCTPLPAQELDRLFDRFYRADPSRNAATGGFGIGLSLARSIAEGHHGTIRAAQENGVITFLAELR